MTVFFSKCKVRSLHERINDFAENKFLRYIAYIPKRSIYYRLGGKLMEKDTEGKRMITPEERKRLLKRLDRFEQANSSSLKERWAR